MQCLQTNHSNSDQQWPFLNTSALWKRQLSFPSQQLLLLISGALICSVTSSWAGRAQPSPALSHIRAAGPVLPSGRWQRDSGHLIGRWEWQHGPKRGLAEKTREVWFLSCRRALAQERQQRWGFQLSSFPIRRSHWVTETLRATTLPTQHALACSLALPSPSWLPGWFWPSLQRLWCSLIISPRRSGPDALWESIVCVENAWSCSKLIKLLPVYFFPNLQDTHFCQRGLARRTELPWRPMVPGSVNWAPVWFSHVLESLQPHIISSAIGCFVPAVSGKKRWKVRFKKLKSKLISLVTDRTWETL